MSSSPEMLAPEAAAGAARSRRTWLAAGVGAAATLAGLGLAWWQSQGSGASVGPSAAKPADGGDASALWSLSFDTPDGRTLAMPSLRGKPLVVNFWATWCPPCVEEFPLLDAFFRQNSAKSWQVIGLAIDQPSAVRKFLERTPVTFPIGMAGLGGTELGQALGNRGGGLPFTVVLGAAGDILQRKMGKLLPHEIDAWQRLA